MPGTQTLIRLGPWHVELRAEGTDLGGSVFQNYRVRLSAGGRTQVLYEQVRIDFELESPHRLEWAGDLDRDGFPDLLVSNLFLSSAAGANEILSRVAPAFGLGGAC